MKIAIVIESFSPHAGGLERSTAQVAQELARRGHAVTLIAGGCADTACLPGITIKAMARRKASGVLRLYRFVKWATEQLDTGGFDTTLSMTTAVPTRVLQPRGGTVWETLERNIAMRPTPSARLSKRLAVLLNPKQQLLLKLEKQALTDERLYKVASLSGYVTRQLEQHYQLPPEKVALIPNAAVMPEVDAEQHADWRQRIRAGFNIPDNMPVFLFAAINPRLKGFGPLLEALAILKAREQDVRVLLAGEFWHEHNRAAERRGVRDRVCFVRHTRQIEALYAAADVTVHPTFYDPASKVVIESLMMGTPAISTAYNGASDLIAPDTLDAPDTPDATRGQPKRGRVIQDPADAESLADAMQALADPETLAGCRAATKGLSGGLSMAGHVDRLETVLAESIA